MFRFLENFTGFKNLIVGVNLVLFPLGPFYSYFYWIYWIFWVFSLVFFYKAIRQKIWKNILRLYFLFCGINVILKISVNDRFFRWFQNWKGRFLKKKTYEGKAVHIKSDHWVVLKKIVPFLAFVDYIFHKCIWNFQISSLFFKANFIFLEKIKLFWSNKFVLN